MKASEEKKKIIIHICILAVSGLGNLGFYKKDQSDGFLNFHFESVV